MSMTHNSILVTHKNVIFVDFFIQASSSVRLLVELPNSAQTFTVAPGTLNDLF